jgi:hypothetical protein
MSLKTILNQIIMCLEVVSLHTDKQQTYFPQLFKPTFRNKRSLSYILSSLQEDYICWPLHPEKRICQFLQNLAKMVNSVINWTRKYRQHMYPFLTFLNEEPKSACTTSS